MLDIFYLRYVEVCERHEATDGRSDSNSTIVVKLAAAVCARVSVSVSLRGWLGGRVSVGK